MTRYVGFIGVRGDLVETASPGLWNEQVIEKKVVGRIEYGNIRWTGDDIAQDEARVNHVVSFVVSEKMKGDFSNPVYATWHGQKWSITTVTYSGKRVKLTLGKVYNGES